MQIIKGILLEPVGCMAEFPAGPFHEIAALLFGKKGKTSKSGSRSYWHLLNLMEAAEQPMDQTQQDLVTALEAAAVAGASMYEDVVPALSELAAMGVHLSIASSLGHEAAVGFLRANSLSGFFPSVWNRDNAGGIKGAPLVRALHAASLQPENTLFLTDTAEGISVARSAGVNPILMMNDPDEARRLATHDPAGGVVSLHELPDFVRLVRAQVAPASGLA
jgi:phosphoglycolate phosphatase-like HAD superfamily hydrolase